MTSADTAMTQFLTEELDASLRGGTKVITGKAQLNFAALQLPAGFEVSHFDVLWVPSPEATGYTFSLVAGDADAANVCKPTITGSLLFTTHPKATLDLLTCGAVNSQRPLPGLIEPVEELGQYGVKWDWENGGVSVITFMQHNAVVRLQGVGAKQQTAALANEIAAMLAGAQTRPHYDTHAGGWLKPLNGHKIPAAGRLDLGMPKASKITSKLRFTTTAGSVNRDAEQPDVWYYRAGLQPGPQSITCISLADGNPPEYQHISLNVISEEQ